MNCAKDGKRQLAKDLDELFNAALATAIVPARRALRATGHNHLADLVGLSGLQLKAGLWPILNGYRITESEVPGAPPVEVPEEEGGAPRA